VEIGAFDVDARHFGFRDDDAFWITVGIEFAVDLQARFWVLPQLLLRRSLQRQHARAEKFWPSPAIHRSFESF
jgi:hypothetical protein